MSFFFPKHTWVDILVLALLALRLAHAIRPAASSSSAISTMLSMWATHLRALGRLG
jgi:cytochrome b